jgi:hypothetical protein
MENEENLNTILPIDECMRPFHRKKTQKITSIFAIIIGAFLALINEKIPIINTQWTTYYPGLIIAALGGIYLWDVLRRKRR